MLLEIQTDWPGLAARKNASRATARSTTLALCFLLASGCVGTGGKDADDPALYDSVQRPARIEALQVEIERDHRSLERLITESEQTADVPFQDEPELREIAIRLMANQQLLERLRSAQSNESKPTK